MKNRIKTVCFVTLGRKFQKFPENSGVKILVSFYGGPLSCIAYYSFFWGFMNHG
jgi:hypothetical protein